MLYFFEGQEGAGGGEVVVVGGGWLKGIASCLTNLTVAPTQNIFKKIKKKYSFNLLCKITNNFFFLLKSKLNNGFISNIPK